jgi:hypothetical protein
MLCGCPFGLCQWRFASGDKGTGLSKSEVFSTVAIEFCNLFHLSSVHAHRVSIEVSKTLVLAVKFYHDSGRHGSSGAFSKDRVARSALQPL